jgi:ribonuclease III
MGSFLEGSCMAEERLAALKDLEAALSYRFRDRGLLDHALTHSSFVNENPDADVRDNERLEFLGDAVLELCVSDLLMKKFPDYREGQLSRLRASVVNEQPLAELARKFNLGDYLLLGKGELSTGGRTKNSLLSNTFEAVIAAVYVDSGFERTAEFIREIFEPLIEEGRAAPSRDYKTALQEMSQNRFRGLPRYTLIGEEGPDHEKIFSVRLSLADAVETTGSGKSKKEAEQQAAKAAIEMLEKTALPETEASDP